METAELTALPLANRLRAMEALLYGIHSAVERRAKHLCRTGMLKC